MISIQEQKRKEKKPHQKRQFLMFSSSMDGRGTVRRYFKSSLLKLLYVMQRYLNVQWPAEQALWYSGKSNQDKASSAV
jgi:hypothetical protein